MSRLLEHPLALCNIARRIAVEAGNATLDYFDESGYDGADAKADGSPVTLADHAAEKIIIDGLRGVLPDVPIIAEESCERGDIPDISGAEYFWLVDALDGTRAFVKGDGDYTVNIALIHNGAPILGVIYAPVHGDLYAGAGPGTALRWSDDTDTEKSIHVRKPDAKGLAVMSSSHHGDPGLLDEFLSGIKVAKLTRRSSSLKICMVAAGKADIYPRFGATSEWDTAAGDAILRAAGGMVADLDGNPFTYGHAGRKFCNPHFIAAPDGWFEKSEDQDA